MLPSGPQEVMPMALQLRGFFPKHESFCRGGAGPNGLLVEPRGRGRGSLAESSGAAAGRQEAARPVLAACVWMLVGLGALAASPGTGELATGVNQQDSPRSTGRPRELGPSPSLTQAPASQRWPGAPFRASPKHGLHRGASLTPLI